MLLSNYQLFRLALPAAWVFTVNLNVASRPSILDASVNLVKARTAKRWRRVRLASALRCGFINEQLTGTEYNLYIFF
jgi:hypothetical protein